MTRVTKKSTNEILAPLFKDYDRYALGFLTMPKVAKPQPVEWNGLTLDIQLIKRTKLVCNVPFPFAVYEFWYEAKRDGKLVVQWAGRPSFIDALHRYAKKEGLI